MNLCVFADNHCTVCGVPRINARQLCGTWRPDVDPPAAVANGPGTELKKILARAGIVATDSCPCNDRAAEMDRQGVDWCKANIDTIVGWLREEAAARGLPFFDIAGRLLVRRAIQNARKAAAGS
jgi:hypothetical protein